MFRRWAALLLLTAGCDAVFGVDDAYRPDAAADAAIVDGYDTTQCPTTYVQIGVLSSRYRLVTSTARPWDHADDCADDAPGATHLVAFSDQLEVQTIQAILDSSASLTITFLGLVQMPVATTPGEGWVQLTGEPALPVWELGQPNDGMDNAPETGQEQFGAMSKGRIGIIDVRATQVGGALCECDGRPVTSEAAQAMDVYRMSDTLRRHEPL